MPTRLRSKLCQSLVAALLLVLPTAQPGSAQSTDCQQPNDAGCPLFLGGLVHAKLSQRGEKHTWQLNVPYAANLILYLYNPNSEYYLYLYDSGPDGGPGKRLAESKNGVNEDQSVLRYLTDPGTYYVFVSVDRAPDRPDVVAPEYWLRAGELGRGIPPAARSGPISLDDARNLKLVGYFHQRGDVLSVAFSPDGRYLAATSTGFGEAAGGSSGYLQEYGVKVWDVQHGVEVGTLLGGGASTVLAVDFSPDGKLVYAAWGNNVIAWQFSDGREVHRYRGGGHEILTLALSPDGKYLATGDVDNLVKLWNTSTGELLTTWNSHTGAVNSVTFSPSGRLLASASADGKVIIADLQTGKELGSIGGHQGSIKSVVFAPDASLLITGGEDDYVNIWDLDSVNKIHSIKGHGRVSKLAFSPDSTLLAVSYSPDRGSPGTIGDLVLPFADGTRISLIDPRAGTEVNTFGQFYPASELAFSPNGQVLASGGTDHMIFFWGVWDGAAFNLWDAGDAQPYVLLSDSFKDIEAAQFPNDANGGTRSSRQYVNGEYVIRKIEPSAGVIFARTTETYTHASLAFDARIVGDPTDASISLGCRDDASKSDDDYRFTVWPADGVFALSRWDNGVRTELVPFTESSAINPDNEWNHYELICAGTAIIARVNDQQVGSALDDSAIRDDKFRTGNFWFGVQRSNQPTEAHFKNALVLLR